MKMCSYSITGCYVVLRLYSR